MSRVTVSTTVNVPPFVGDAVDVESVDIVMDGCSVNTLELLLYKHPSVPTYTVSCEYVVEELACDVDPIRYIFDDVFVDPAVFLVLVSV